MARVASPLPEGEDKVHAIGEMFDAIAPRYDRVNRIMTFRMDVGWRRLTLDSLALAPGSSVLDIAAGTGDLCREMEKRDLRPIALDLSAGMLRNARTDALTGLPNRSAMLELVASASERAWGTPRQPTVLFIDVDRFKTINDSLGHSAGDTVLLEVAGRLLAAVPPHASVGRISGDEFVVLDPTTETATQAVVLAERGDEQIAVRRQHDGQPRVPHDADQLDQLDRALGVHVRIVDEQDQQRRRRGRAKKRTTEILHQRVEEAMEGGAHVEALALGLLELVHIGFGVERGGAARQVVIPAEADGLHQLSPVLDAREGALTGWGPGRQIALAGRHR